MIAFAAGGGLGQRAQGSSFSMAMKILPSEQRSAMLAVYGYCRAVDDIADEPGTDGAERLRQLQEWRTAIGALYGREPPAAVGSLVGPIARFGLRREDFEAVIEGMVMDVTGAALAPDWQALEHYCDCVACAVGRLSVRIFGLDGTRGDALARHLGMALQLTNILRDLDEDARMGRLYLPREALDRAGIPAATIAAVLDHPRLGVACAELATRAGEHFAEAARIMDDCPRHAVRAPRLMASAYRSILDQLLAGGWVPPRVRVGTDRIRLAGALLRYGLF